MSPDESVPSPEQNPFAAPVERLEGFTFSPPESPSEPVVPPWEGRGPVVRRFWETLRMITTRMEYAFGKMNPSDITPAFTFASICVGAYVFIRMLIADAISPSHQESYDWLNLLLAGPIEIAVQLARVILFGMLQHCGLRFWGRLQHPLGATIKAALYANSPAILSDLVPGFGALFFIVGSMILTGHASAKMHGMKDWKGDLVALLAFPASFFIVHASVQRLDTFLSA